MVSVLSTALTVSATVVSGMVLFLVQRFFAKQQKKETVILFQSLNALGKLSVANSIALRDGRTNGELSLALGEFERAEKQLYDYLVSSHAESHGE